MAMKKLSVDEWHALYPDDAIRQAFVTREDIRDLPAAVQEARWQAHRAHLEKFFGQLSQWETFIWGHDDAEPSA